MNIVASYKAIVTFHLCVNYVSNNDDEPIKIKEITVKEKK